MSKTFWQVWGVQKKTKTFIYSKSIMEYENGNGSKRLDIEKKMGEKDGQKVDHVTGWLYAR